MKMMQTGLLVLCAFAVMPVHAESSTELKTSATVKTAAVKTQAPVVSNAWISEAPPVAKNNAAFVTVKNGARKDVLLSVASPAAEAAEFHQMSMAGGLMRMQQLPLIHLAAHAELKFAPGGRHIMLINMKKPLKTGDRVPLILTFRKAGKITVQAEVRALDVDSDAPTHTPDDNAASQHDHAGH